MNYIEYLFSNKHNFAMDESVCLQIEDSIALDANGLTHPDGSPCNAKSEKSCPILKKENESQNADDLTNPLLEKTPFMESMLKIRDQLVELYRKGTEQRLAYNKALQKMVSKYGKNYGESILKMDKIIKYNPSTGKLTPYGKNPREQSDAAAVLRNLEKRDYFTIKQFKTCIGRYNQKMNNLISQAQQECSWQPEHGYDQTTYRAFLEDVKKRALGSNQNSINS